MIDTLVYKKSSLLWDILVKWYNRTRHWSRVMRVKDHKRCVIVERIRITAVTATWCAYRPRIARASSAMGFLAIVPIRLLSLNGQD